jgi:hypothetical protein
MKKITTLLTVCTVLSANAAFAQESTTSANMNDKNQDSMTMRDRNQPPCRSTQDFAWGTAVVALAVLGTVVGLTVSQAN